ncbi:heme peroxidase [Cynara cardunculus var. scolymus]|uniref:Heme peroxidase n=1 Tax=Cynara cardunculus var. scolymus TaxID=59895 RepID=A0A118JTZ8_CYNCS|nr:heme peroxidase [Cynara cardunculus var. scolymus]
MSITGFDLSLRNLCSPNIPQFALRFKFPAQVRRKTDYGCNCTCTAVRPALCSTSSSSSTAVSDSRDADENHVPTSYGRRMMISVFGFLFPLHGSMQSSGANAADDLLLLQGEIRKVLSKGKAAGVLRLVFHDAGTYEMDEDSGGMNGSISFELDRPENKGLKKSLKILVEAKKIVDETQPGSHRPWNYGILSPLSLADMIAVAGAEAVSLCGGPKIPVQLGRLDSMVPDPEGKLPEETLDAFGLKHSFQRKALSGAHTLGSKGFGNPVIFDNAYYKVLLEKPWLSSDRALIEDDECLRWISKYGDDQDLFFEDFKNAYIKLVNSGAKWRRNS